MKIEIGNGNGNAPIAGARYCSSLVTSPRTPPREKRSGERSRISWAYYPKAVRTNEIARSVIIT